MGELIDPENKDIYLTRNVGRIRDGIFMFLWQEEKGCENYFDWAFKKIEESELGWTKKRMVQRIVAGGTYWIKGSPKKRELILPKEFFRGEKAEKGDFEQGLGEIIDRFPHTILIQFQKNVREEVKALTDIQKDDSQKD